MSLPGRNGGQGKWAEWIEGGRIPPVESFDAVDGALLQ